MGGEAGGPLAWRVCDVWDERVEVSTVATLPLVNMDSENMHMATVRFQRPLPSSRPPSLAPFSSPPPSLAPPFSLAPSLAPSRPARTLRCSGSSRLRQ